jgi:hypothetical protein
MKCLGMTLTWTLLMASSALAADNAAVGKQDERRRAWQQATLRKMPIAYRHDGFSMFFRPEGMTRASLLRDYVEPFRGSNVEILVWGLGPGSVFCFDTKVGQVFGAPLGEEQWKLMRSGDRQVYENVAGLIRAGADPLKTAVVGAHAIGRKLFARLEMNHEYGPADPANWLWVGLVGEFNKKHPEYRIPGSVRLDFKHPAVRAFKLAIFREAVEAGADGLELDFAVYPPHFAQPDCAVMTEFMRDVRALLDQVGKREKRRLEVMARVPSRDAIELGLDWKTWIRQRLVDIIVPTHRRPNEAFDVNIDEFVALSKGTACKVYPTLWQALGFVTTDQQPGDEQKGIRRYDKPKTKEMFFAQALLFHRAGADGLQLGFAANEWNSRPWLNDLADPAKVEFADKHYMVDPQPHCPVRLAKRGPIPVMERTVPLRIGDDPARALRMGYRVEAELLLYGRALKPGESLAVWVNGQGPAVLAGTSGKPAKDEAAVEIGRQRDPSVIFQRDWWRRGQLRIPVSGAWWQLGGNTIRLVYQAQAPAAPEEMSIVWIDLLLRYRRK